jgi:TfoX/Sxy family transcriptional regulator of competence genes
MAYDKDIERTIERAYRAASRLESRLMFGGICYLYKGNMAFGIYKDNLIVRVGSPDEVRRYIDSGKALPFDVTGRAMKAWVMVPKSNLSSTRDYKQWLDKGLNYAKTLPPK